MRKILLSSLLLSSLVLADKIAIPMSANLLSVENSGSLSAIDAYQDGIGIYTVEQIGSAIIDNSEMNSLVYKYGAEAKTAEVNIKDYILSNGNAAEKVLASEFGKFKPIAPGNDTICDDNNTQTINDKYTNGICSGIIATSCSELKNIDINLESGYYNIDIDNNEATSPISIYCDMTTAGGGWIKTTAIEILQNNLSFSQVNGLTNSQLIIFKDILSKDINNLRKILISEYILWQQSGSYFSQYKTINIPDTMSNGSLFKVLVTVGTWYNDSDTGRFYFSLMDTLGNQTQSTDTGHVNWGGYSCPDSFAGAGSGLLCTDLSFSKIYNNNYNRAYVEGFCNRVAGAICSAAVGPVTLLFNYDLPSKTDYILIK